MPSSMLWAARNQPMARPCAHFTRGAWPWRIALLLHRRGATCPINPRDDPSCCTIRTTISGRCCFCSIPFAPATGMISGCGMRFARRLPFCPQALSPSFCSRPEAPGDCSSPVPCLFACTQFSDWSGLWRQPPTCTVFSLVLCALANKCLSLGRFFDCKSHAGPRPPPFSDPGKGPVGRKVPPAISAGTWKAPPLGSAATRPIVDRLGSGELQVKPGAFDVVERTHLVEKTLQALQSTQHKRDPAGRPAVHYPAAVRR